MIFVVDAIGRRMCLRFAQRTWPVAASMTMAAGALTYGALGLWGTAGGATDDERRQTRHYDPPPGHGERV